MSRSSVVSLAILAVIIAFLYEQISVPIDPIEYETEAVPRPKEGPLGPNNDLVDVKHIAKGIDAPETVVFDADGNLFAFTEFGRIVQIFPNDTFVEWAYTGGRPLSGMFDANGDLIVAEVNKGLLKIKKDTREIVILAARTTDGQPLNFIDDLDIASDGKIYFSDASSIVPQRGRDGFFDLRLISIFEFLEGRKTGRLVVYDPKTGLAEVLISDLAFANGVVVSQDQTYVLVCETFGKQVYRYWLQGQKKGTKEIFVEPLPFYVDGISPRPNGNYWIALVGPDEIPPFLHRFPFLKTLISKLLLAPLSENQPHFGGILEVDQNGKPVRAFYDLEGKSMHGVTSVTERDGKLYLGSFNDFVGVKTLQDL